MTENDVRGTALPFDIICNVIDHCALDKSRRDLRTLQSLALLNWSCKIHADKYIWRDIALIHRAGSSGNYGNSSLSTFRSRCQALITDHRRAGRVRTLEVVFKKRLYVDYAILENDSDGAYLDGNFAENRERELFKEGFDLMARAIHACRSNLEELRIYGPAHMADVGQALRDLVLDSAGRLRLFPQQPNIGLPLYDGELGV